MQGYLIIDGDVHALEIHRLPGGGYRFPDGRRIFLDPPDQTRSRRIHVGEVVHGAEVAAIADRIWIHLRGRAHEIIWRNAVDHHAAKTDMAGDGTVRAPMPGGVTTVLVRVGDIVDLGDPVIVIDSMKLETTLRAPRGGAVRSVNVAIGDSFEHDAILVEIEARC
jgi:acetyl/propionyl-CoA carboxylase alpha subunit